MAHYEARVNAADLNRTATPIVYKNGVCYYIELPRYRYGKPVKVQLSAFDQDVSEPTLERRGTGMYRIPESFAMYLTGQTNELKEYVYLKEVEDAEDIKRLSSWLPVVNKADEHMVSYSYTSPNSGWLYTAAPFNWLLVDLPVTLVENAVIAAAVAGVIWVAYEEAKREEEEERCEEGYY